MLRILIIILASYFPAYEAKQPETQQATEPVEFGDCIQLPPQKTLGEE